MKTLFCTIFCCLILQFSYGQGGFWGLKFGTSADSTGKIVFDKYDLRSYNNDKRKLTYRDGTFGAKKFATLTLLFNQSDQLYRGVFIFRPGTYQDMVYEYRYLKWFIELRSGKPGVSVDEYPGGKDNSGTVTSETTSANYTAYTIWYLPNGSDETTSTATILLKIIFDNDTPVISLEYQSNKFGKGLMEHPVGNRIADH